MALIKCPECNRLVSTMASVCPNCGYPLVNSETTTCVIDGRVYDLSEQLRKIKIGDDDGFRSSCIEIKHMTGLDILDANKLALEMDRTHKVPSHFSPEESSNASNAPRCPTCNSTNIERINFSTKAAASILFGFASSTARGQFHCKNCGYKW